MHANGGEILAEPRLHLGPHGGWQRVRRAGLDQRPHGAVTHRTLPLVRRADRPGGIAIGGGGRFACPPGMDCVGHRIIHLTGSFCRIQGVSLEKCFDVVCLPVYLIGSARAEHVLEVLQLAFGNIPFQWHAHITGYLELPGRPPWRNFADWYGWEHGSFALSTGSTVATTVTLHPNMIGDEGH
jgi:hypothetical protein